MEHADTERVPVASAATHPEHVMLATDGGPAGIAAARWLAERRSRRPLDVEIVAVVEPGDQLGAEPGEPERAAGRAADEARALLERLAPGIAVGSTVLAGEPVRTLRHAARAADLLVVGTDRTARRGLHVSPSFATRLAADALCPTVVVRSAWESSGGPVVVGIAGDGSEDEALAFAAREAEELGRDLVLVHAWRLAAGAAPSDVGDPGPRAANEALRAAAARLRIGRPDLRIVPVLTATRPIRALERAALGAALVVVGSRGLDALDRMLSRSVSRAALERLACPVAVVPQGG
ncbi:MAG: universal stress protein [Acidobacteria bacterium]|nr:universal stress protein [Acidobacteriota bacterium]